MGWLFTRLTMADLKRLEQMMEGVVELVEKLKLQTKGDRARVGKCERMVRENNQLFRESLHQLMIQPPPAIEGDVEEVDVDEVQDKEELRLRVPPIVRH